MCNYSEMDNTDGFYGAADKPAIIAPTKFNSAHKTYLLTSASRPQRHHVWAEVGGHVQCTVKVHYAFCL